MLKLVVLAVLAAILVDAASKCDKFEEWKDSQPEGTCANPRPKPGPKGPKKCQCQPNCVRHQSKCIPIAQCPKPTTTTPRPTTPRCGPNEVWKESQNEGTCAKPNPNPGPKGPKKCQCIPKCVRHEGKCIATHQCPKPTTTPIATTRTSTRKPSTAPPSTVKPSTASPSTVKPSTASPSTVKPSTAKHSTVKPSTASPSTANPSTASPSTAKPSTASPSTAKPSTASPSTAKPSTAAPSTGKPSTASPSTLKPSTASPSTAKPSTASPSTAKPSTASPSTLKPSTASPSTAKPSTASPSTAKPSTASPSTAKPSTASPSTAKPSTASPSTAAPSTASPSTAKPSTASPATSAPSTSLAPSTSPAACDCVNVIRGVCQAVGDAEKCVAACQGLGLGAGVCVDLLGVDVEAALCVCVGPFQPGAGGGNGCEANTTPVVPTTTPSVTPSEGSTAAPSTGVPSTASPATSAPSTSLAPATSPAPCDCVNVIRGVCQAVEDTEKCVAACQGLGLGAGVCLDLPDIVDLEAAICVCIGPFQPGSGGNGCGAASTPALPTTTQSIPSTASESVSSTNAPSTSLAPSSSPAPCDCVNVIRGVCQAVGDTEKCVAACQGLGLGAGFCVGVLGVNAEAALCVCIGPFQPGSGGGNGCEASTTPGLPSTTPSVASTASESASSTNGPSTSLAPSSPAPCDCVNVIRGVCRAVEDADKCVAACQGLGLGAGVCVDLLGLDVEAALCVCVGPFQPGSGGNGCGGGSTPSLPSTTPGVDTTASESASSSSAPSTSLAPSSSPAPCDCVNVIRGVCRAVEDADKCVAACQGLGLGAGVCVDLLGLDVEAALCVCVGPFQPGSGGSNGCGGGSTPSLPSTTPNVDTTASESASSSSALTTVAASTTQAPCDCVNVIRGVCQAVGDADKCVVACQGLGLGAGVCVDLLGVDVDAALCVCVGPFQPGSGGSNGCEANTTPVLPSSTPSIAPSESTTAPASPSTSAVSTAAPGPCMSSIDDICNDPLSVIDNANCDQQCKLLGLRGGVCIGLPPILQIGVALCVCL